MRVGLAREADVATEKLEQVLALEPPNETRALELADHIGDLRAQQFKRFVRSILVVRRTLTPQQIRILTGDQ